MKKKIIENSPVSKRNVLCFKDFLDEDDNESKKILSKKSNLNLDISTSLNEIFNNLQNGILVKNEINSKDNNEKFIYPPFDHSISNSIEIKIYIKSKSKSNETINLIDNYFTDNKFFYYEYNHFANNKLNIGSNFDYMFDNKDKKNFKLDINYVEAMTSLLYSFMGNKENNFFYMITKLMSIYFFKIDNLSIWKGKDGIITNSGIIITNFNHNLKNKLKENKIEYKKIKNKNSKDISKLYYISSYYQFIFFNLIMNEFESYQFDIYSNFPFSCASYKQHKFKIDKYISKEKTEMNVYLFGCFFHKYIEEILNFLKNKTDTYNISFHHMNNTDHYFTINRDITGNIKKIEYSDKNYYITYD